MGTIGTFATSRWIRRRWRYSSKTDVYPTQSNLVRGRRHNEYLTELPTTAGNNAHAAGCIMDQHVRF